MNKTSGISGQASVPMNLFATWEIDRSSSNCIPRICTMTVCKLVVLRELDKDVQSVFIAVKMQGSKRVFRSNEIFMSSNGLVNTKLELTFSLQYPHFVKRDENRLEIMLQRKKRYKNRSMLGYKTLAHGRIDMGQIIQCPIPDESVLDLFAAGKEQHAGVVVVAHIVVSSMSSLPIDADMESDRSGKHGGNDRSPEVDNYSEDDEETYSSDQDLGSDNPQEYAEDDGRAQKRKNRHKVRMSSSSRQQNFIKSKVAALLRKFKQVADEDLDPGLGQDADGHPAVPVDYDFLYDELEDFNLSDSCPEVDDNISIVSTPKPKLRPFFDRISHSSSQTEISSLREQPSMEQSDIQSDQQKFQASLPHSEQIGIQGMVPHSLKTNSGSWDSAEWDLQGATTNPLNKNEFKSHYITSPPGENNHASSAPSSPEPKPAHAHEASNKPWTRSASFRDPLHSDHQKEAKTEPSPHNDPTCDFFIGAEDGLPEMVFLIDGNDRHCHCIANALNTPTVGLPTPLITRSIHDIEAVFAGFLSRLQKYLNSNSQSPTPVKVAVVGTDTYLNSVLRQFVECLSARSSDWQSFLIFLVIPIGPHRVARYLSTIDSRYGSLFGESSWKERIEKLVDTPPSGDKNQELLTIASKLREYMSEASHVVSLTIAEAMLTFRQTSGDEDCSHKFLPFISDVKVGENELLNIMDSDREDGFATTAASNPPASSVVSPPSSPSVPVSSIVPAAVTTGSIGVTGQPAEVKLGLQVDYWKERDASKYTLKTNFKSFHVSRLPHNGERSPLPGLALDVVTRGKKNIMRLPGKKGKEKDSESKSQAVANISRLICASKHQHGLLQVKIDNVEWRDVKFFQLSSHWSSHVKAFPISVFQSA